MRRVHPLATKRNIAMVDTNDQDITTQMHGNPGKKLRRLPHVFDKVLELPFRSDADVTIEDKPEVIRFVAQIEVDGDDVGAQAVEIHPGVTKIVVRNGVGDDVELLLDYLNIDMWRFRLPSSARPEMVTVVFVDGEIIVTVPKVDVGEIQDERGVWRNGGRLVLVQ